MGTLKLGLGSDPSTDSEDDLKRANQDAVDQFMIRVLDSRFGWLLVPFALAVFFFLWDWGGYRGKFMPWGDPRPRVEVWWHLPIYFAGLAISLRAFGWFKRS
jgi:hypothetical protein